MNILLPPFKEEVVAVVQFTPQERLQERIVEQSVNATGPPTEEGIVEVVQHVPQECMQMRIGDGPLWFLRSWRNSRSCFGRHFTSASSNELRSRSWISLFFCASVLASEAHARTSRQGDGGIPCSFDPGQSHEDFFLDSAIPSVTLLRCEGSYVSPPHSHTAWSICNRSDSQARRT